MKNLPDPASPPQPLPSGYVVLQHHPADHGGDSGELFDWQLIGSYAGFVLHSIRRHKRLFLSIWVGIVAFSLVLMWALPKTYQVKTILQANRNQIMPALSNPTRAIPMDADTPTRQAAETVQRYDNLVALIQQTELIKNWQLHRAPLHRVKDAIWRVLFKPPKPEDEMEDFVYYLRNRLWVTTGEGIVTIGIEFPDPQQAYRLVNTAVENFLEARHAAEVSTISEAITILESRADQAHQALAAALRQLEAARDERSARLGRRVRTRSAGETRAPAEPDQETSRMLLSVQSKRRAIADLDEFRRRRVTELQTKLQEQRAVYAANHPVILDIEQSLDAVRQESPQVTALKRDVASLDADLKKRGASDQPEREVGRPTAVVIQAEHLGAFDPREDEDPQIGYLREQVNFALTKYNSFLDRIEGARLELDSARAAFKYRYTVLVPVQKPRGPIKPKPKLVLGASLIAGLALALLCTAFVDLRSRRFLESWQVERALKVPLLGEIRGVMERS